VTTLKTQDTDVFATTQPGIVFDTTDESWTITTSVLVSGNKNDGVDGSDDRQALTNQGSILTDAFGVTMTGSHAAIVNSDDARIIAVLAGVFADGDTVAIDNHGTIASLTRDGIDFGSDSSHVSLENSGSISGRYTGVLLSSGAGGASGADGGSIRNAGLIRADHDGIVVFTAAGMTSTIVNAAGATIRGGQVAIEVEKGGISLDNHGTVVGNVDASSASDRDVVGNHGSITGAVFLGGGNDIFVGSGGTSGAVLGDNGNDQLTGGRGGDTLYGDAGADRLIGGGGNDQLDGGSGDDTLTGGQGRDQFFFRSDISASNNVDKITDFNVHADKIVLGDRVFAGIGHGGVLPSGMFHIGAAAHDGNDHIIYNPSSGFLNYDANGNRPGDAVHFATLAPHLALTHADFLVTELPVS
jgi:serralysin